MTDNNRKLLRVAVKIHDYLSQQGPLPATIGNLDYSCLQFQRLKRQIQRADERKWHLASQKLFKELVESSQRFQREVQAVVYRTLFGLLACTGLRVSEALKLNAADVDLERGVLRIVQTKFKKSRLVPLHPTATRALRRYAQSRFGDRCVNGDSPFFVAARGNRLYYSVVCRVFQELRDILGWKKGNGELPRPRIHDLRHTFACRRLLCWYRQGKNVHNLVAALSTYMGHGKVTDTYWYLTGTPELLAIAGGRFERFAQTEKGERT